MESELRGRIAVRPHAECPIRALSERTRVRRFVPGRVGTSVPRVVLDDDADVSGDPAVRMVRRDGLSFEYRLPDVGPTPLNSESDRETDLTGETKGEGEKERKEKGQGEGEPPVCRNYGARGCLAFGFEFLPIDVSGLDWKDGWLHFSFTAESYAEVQTSVERLNDADFDIDVRRVGPRRANARTSAATD